MYVAFYERGKDFICAVSEPIDPLDNFCKDLGLKIQAARKLKNMTQIALAAVLDLDVKTIQRIEKGTEPTTFKTIDKIEG